MDNASPASKKSFNEWLRQLSDDDRQVLTWWLDRKLENPDHAWGGAKRICKRMGNIEVPYRIIRTEEE